MSKERFKSSPYQVKCDGTHERKLGRDEDRNP